MAADVFNGQVQGLSKIASGVPSAFCREVTGGNLRLISHDPGIVGIGGQWVSRKGTLEAILTWSCIGPAHADTAKWFPTTAGVQVASFFDFLVEADDGTNGKEFTLSDGQPGTCKIASTEAEDAMVLYDFTAKFATVAQAAIGTDVPVYNSVKGHTINDATVQFAAADKGCLSFELSNDLGLVMNNPMDTKSAGEKTWPDGYVISPSAPPSFSCVTSDMYQGEAADILADTWTAIAITIALANGTGGEDITATLTDYKPAGDAFNMPLEASGKVGFGHAFEAAAGTIYNRVGFA